MPDPAVGPQRLVTHTDDAELIGAMDFWIKNEKPKGW
jgi:hypothetical protein